MKLQCYRKEFENMKIKENENLNYYSSRFTELVNQMKVYGQEISNNKIVEKVLISVLENFDPIVVVIE